MLSAYSASSILIQTGSDWPCMSDHSGFGQRLVGKTTMNGREIRTHAIITENGCSASLLAGLPPTFHPTRAQEMFAVTFGQLHFSNILVVRANIGVLCGLPKANKMRLRKLLKFVQRKLGRVRATLQTNIDALKMTKTKYLCNVD